MTDLELIALLVFFFLLSVCSWILYFLSHKKLSRLRADSEDLLSELNRYKKEIQDYELEHRNVYLNPHIFKNTLNAIQSYAYKTHFALDKLGGVLDYILYDSKANFTTLKEETEFFRDFIELNKFRLHPLLDFKMEIDVDEYNIFYDKKIILPLITVDFIENALRHGDLSGEKGIIHILMKLNEKNFYYEVVNAVNPRPIVSAAKGGLGQQQLKERLEMIYGDNYELKYHCEKGLYKAIMNLNLYEINRKMHITG